MPLDDFRTDKRLYLQSLMCNQRLCLQSSRNRKNFGFCRSILANANEWLCSSWRKGLISSSDVSRVVYISRRLRNFLGTKNSTGFSYSIEESVMASYQALIGYRNRGRSDWLCCIVSYEWHCAAEPQGLFWCPLVSVTEPWSHKCRFIACLKSLSWL